MKKFLMLSAILLGIAPVLFAQESPRGVCGTSTADQLLSDPTFLDPSAATDRSAIQYIPIHFHLVGDAQGQGKVKESKVLDQLCALNAAYEPMEMRFYLSPHPTLGLFDYSINSTNVYENQTSTSLMNSKRHKNALNVFVTNLAASGNNQPGVTLAYWTATFDWIVCRRDMINGAASNSTIPHEVGHFFNLDHTFTGWEITSFTPAHPSWPNAPAVSPDFGVPVEKVDGSNCTVAADKICDTPPDYGFGFVDNDCVYTGGAKDPMGVPVDPMENNMLSYFNGCSTYVFTPMQQSVMLASLASSKRNYLDNTFQPVSTTINTPTDLLISPEANATIQFYDQALLEWQAVTGATYYLLEVDITNAYNTTFNKTFIVNTNSKLITNLEKNRTYFWRVRPFNEYVTCAAARQRSFKTPGTSALRDIEGLNAWQISPNPAPNGTAITLAVDAGKSFDAAIRVVDAAGRVVFEQQGASFAAGESSQSLSLGGLSNGLYFVTLQSAEGQSVRRLVVLN